jgi:predicted O-methyltransferase YrrM
VTRTAEELADWQGYLTRREVAFLKILAEMLPKNPVIVNIGAGAGTSTLAFLEARADCTVISIDLLTTESETTTNEHLRLAEIAPEDAARVIRIWGDSAQTGHAWPFPAVDMVFVDGDHVAAGVQADIDAWLSHVKHTIAFHDYTRKAWPDVKQVVDAAMQGYRAIGQVDTVRAFEVGG